VTDSDPLADIRSHYWNESSGERGPRCLTDERIAGLADGALDRAARAEAVRHLAECVYCRRSLAALARALGDPAVAAAAPPSRIPRRRFVGLAVPAAVAAVLLIAVLGRERALDAPSTSHRAPETTAVDQPEAITPVGAVARPRLLRWGSVVGADRYRVTLFHADGRALYELELGDTAATLPDSIELLPGERYLWKVEARTGWERWSSSRLFEFSVAERRTQ